MAGETPQEKATTVVAALRNIVIDKKGNTIGDRVLTTEQISQLPEREGWNKTCLYIASFLNATKAGDRDTGPRTSKNMHVLYPFLPTRAQ